MPTIAICVHQTASPSAHRARTTTVAAHATPSATHSTAFAAVAPFRQTTPVRSTPAASPAATPPAVRTHCRCPHTDSKLPRRLYPAHATSLPAPSGHSRTADMQDAHSHAQDTARVQSSDKEAQPTTVRHENLLLCRVLHPLNPRHHLRPRLQSCPSVKRHNRQVVPIHTRRELIQPQLRCRIDASLA